MYLHGKTSNDDLETENRREHSGLRMEQRCRTHGHPAMTWIPVAALSAYIGAGVLIISTPSARWVMRKECAGVAGPIHPLSPRPSYPRWKIIAFFTLVYAGSLLAWPLFLRSWFPRKIHVPEPSRGVPKGWLVRQLGDEEIVLLEQEFQTPMRAGVALVRNEEVVDSHVTRMN